MEFIDLFKIGDISYPELDKPVRYSDEFLKSIASSTGTININNDHDDEVIGSLENFVFEDGVLKCQKPSIELSGLGLSPEFKLDLKDCGGYYEPINYSLIGVGLTDSPRSNILYNSNGDAKMTENFRELLDRKDEIVTDQQEQIALLKKQVEDLKGLVKGKDDIDKELESKIKELEEAQSLVNDYKADAEKLRSWEAENKAKIIKEIAGDEAPAYLNKLTTEELLDMKEKTIRTDPVKGVDTKNPSVDTDGEISSEAKKQAEEDALYTEEAFLEWDNANRRFGKTQ